MLNSRAVYYAVIYLGSMRARIIEIGYKTADLQAIPIPVVIGTLSLYIKTGAVPIRK
jgi:hypothetical protein